jgi:hypothetical protein
MLKKKIAMPIVSKAIQYKTCKLAKSHTITWLQFKSSMGWCVLMVWRNKFSLYQNLTVDFEEKNFALQQHVIRLHKMEHYILCQIGNFDETPVYFDMPLNHAIGDDVAKSVAMKTSGNKGCNYHVDSISGRWQLTIIYDHNRKTIPKEQLHREITVSCQPKGWITRASSGVEQKDSGDPEKMECWSWMLLRDI